MDADHAENEQGRCSTAQGALLIVLHRVGDDHKGSRRRLDAPSATTHVCIKVPQPKDALRRTYTTLTDREQWVHNRLGDHGVYVGRPKNDGGWYKSATVKAGSLFANPFSLKEYSLDESLTRYREMVKVRAADDVTTDQVIELLPPSQRTLARRRHAGGEDRAGEGRSCAHLQLRVIGIAFRERLRALRGRKLGCFCDEASPCHAKILAELADTLLDDGTTGCAADHPSDRLGKRKRAETVDDSF